MHFQDALPKAVYVLEIWKTDQYISKFILHFVRFWNSKGGRFFSFPLYVGWFDEISVQAYTIICQISLTFFIYFIFLYNKNHLLNAGIVKTDSITN